MSKRKQQQRQDLNVLVLGNSNTGKSTLINYFVNYHQDIDSSSNDLLEQLKCDYERGDDINRSIYSFQINKTRLNIIDVQGHCRFIKNRLLSSSQIDLVLLIISADENVDEYFHSIEFISCLSIEQLIIIINKMDLTIPSYSQEIFDRIRNQILDLMTRIAYNPKTLIFIPTAAIYKENLIEKSSNLSWYANLTVNEAFDSMNRSVDDRQTKPLRLSISDIYKIGGIGVVPVGRVATGVLKLNMTIKLTPSNLSAKVKSIEMPGNIAEALPGDNIGFHLDRLRFEDFKRGFVCSDSEHSPAEEALSFLAYIVILDDSSVRISVDSELTLCCHTARVQCRIIEIKTRLNRRTGKPLKINQNQLKSKEIVLVRINPLNPICIETFADYPPLGRFLLRQIDKIIAVGLVTQVDKKNK